MREGGLATETSTILLQLRQIHSTGIQLASRKGSGGSVGDPTRNSHLRRPPAPTERRTARSPKRKRSLSPSGQTNNTRLTDPAKKHPTTHLSSSPLSVKEVRLGLQFFELAYSFLGAVLGPLEPHGYPPVPMFVAPFGAKSACGQ